jgi:hypothetical protein
VRKATIALKRLHTLNPPNLGFTPAIQAVLTSNHVLLIPSSCTPSLKIAILVPVVTLAKTKALLLQSFVLKELSDLSFKVLSAYLVSKEPFHSIEELKTL